MVIRQGRKTRGWESDRTAALCQSIHVCCRGARGCLGVVGTEGLGGDREGTRAGRGGVLLGGGGGFGPAALGFMMPRLKQAGFPRHSVKSSTYRRGSSFLLFFCSFHEGTPVG